MINFTYGQYFASCNICDEELPPEDTFVAAARAARAAGWKQQKTQGECEHLCAVCRELEK